MGENSQPSPALLKLQRWEGSGAIWRVTARTGGRVRIDLVTCTGGQVMETFESADTDVLAWIGSRDSSEGA